jgi:para-aminobenzoate synthetase / 4-amino-4-deoxychorismate lyase
MEQIPRLWRHAALTRIAGVGFPVVLMHEPASLICRPVGWDHSPADVLRMLRADAHPVALLGAWAGGSDIVAAEPVQVTSDPWAQRALGPPGMPGMPGFAADVPRGAPGAVPPGGGCMPGSFAFPPGMPRGVRGVVPPGDNCAPSQLAGFGDSQLAGFGDPQLAGFGGAQVAGFAGGWIGYLGYGASPRFLPVPPAPGGPRRLPAAWWGFYDHVLRRDRATGQWFFEALAHPARAEAIEERFGELVSRGRSVERSARGFSCGPFELVPSAAEHRQAVRKTVDYIRAGDIFQANICLRLEAAFRGDPLDAFCEAVTRLDPRYAAFLSLPEGGAVASMSPELFLRRTGDRVLSSPIKGTRPRPADAAAAQASREELTRSAKDEAENVMIVDLMRNDLSRVCAPGSVQVPALLRAEPHPGVWHLVSDVTGRLAPGAGDAALIAATFPPGSVTGAPKVRALEVIHELEAAPREAYTGAIGYHSPVAGLELNVAIRTFEFHGDRVWLGAGGGITARSDPDAEFRECLVKAAPLVAALDSVIAGPGAAPLAPADDMALRPRPAAGVFTSVLVREGQVHDLAEHLARLEASTVSLYGKRLPARTGDALASCLAARPSGRLRVTARPAGGPLRVTVEVVPTAPAGSAVLRPVVVPGGVGPHKWRDRRLLSRLASRMSRAPGEHLLLVDTSGDVLETDRASVFAVLDGVLCTPPLDGRLLPGVTRAAILRLAEDLGICVKESPLTLDVLAAATEVFAANAVHGIIPARRLTAPEAAWDAGPVALSLGEALASRPLSAVPPAELASRAAPPSRAGTAPPLPAPERAKPPARATPARATPPERGKPGHPGARALVILVDNYDSFTYNLAHLLIGSGCHVEVVRNDEVSAAGIAAARPAGIVISPGPCAPAEAGISVDVVRECGPVTPLLGICLGHQAIASAYGGRVVRAPAPAHGYASAVTHDASGVLAGLPQGFPAARYHSLTVDEQALPAGLIVTARLATGAVMGVRHASHPVEGVQFHPESILTVPHGRAIIANFAQRLALPGAGRLRPGVPPGD